MVGNIRNNNLNGTDWVKEHPTYQDMNTTNNAILNFAASGVAQNAYQILQANDEFENKDFLIADEFVTSSGTNETKTGGTAIYSGDNDYYRLSTTTSGDGTDRVATHDATLSSAAGTTTTKWGLYGTTLTDCVVTTILKHTQSTATTAYIETSAGVVLSSASFSGTTATFPSYKLIDGNEYWFVLNSGGSSWVIGWDDNSVTFTDSVNLNLVGGIASDTLKNINAAYAITSITTQTTPYNSSSTVICDNNTLNLTGSENSICIYGDKSIPTNTNISVNISDGTSTLSGKSFNEVIGLTGFTTGTLSLTFNLSSTLSSTTPYIKGYGVYIK